MLAPGFGGISNDPKTLDIGRPTVVGNRDSDVGMFGIGNSEPIASQCLKPITHHHFAHCRMLQTRGTPMSEIEKPISHMATSTMAMTMLTHRLLECWEMDSCFHREVEAPPPMSVAARCRTGLFMVVICDSSSVALVTSRSIHILHQLVVNMDWKFQCIRVV